MNGPFMAMLVDVNVTYEIHSTLCLQPREGAGVTGWATGLCSRSLEFPSLLSRVIIINVPSNTGYSSQEKSWVTVLVGWFRARDYLFYLSEGSWRGTEFLTVRSRPVPGGDHQEYLFPFFFFYHFVLSVTFSDRKCPLSK